MGQGFSCVVVHDYEDDLFRAAQLGELEIVEALLEKDPSRLQQRVSYDRQSVLHVAASNGQIEVLKFDSLKGRTCLHYAAYYGHSDCLQAILSSAQSSPVAESWGYARFVNIRDGGGATSLHLAARQRRPNCLHILLKSGALVCASTGGYGT